MLFDVTTGEELSRAASLVLGVCVRDSMQEGGVAVNLGEQDRSKRRLERIGLRLLKTHGISTGPADSALPSQVKAEDSLYELSCTILQMSNALGQGRPRGPVAWCWIVCQHRMYVLLNLLTPYNCRWDLKSVLLD